MAKVLTLVRRTVAEKPAKRLMLNQLTAASRQFDSRDTSAWRPMVWCSMLFSSLSFTEAYDFGLKIFKKKLDGVVERITEQATTILVCEGAPPTSGYEPNGFESKVPNAPTTQETTASSPMAGMKRKHIDDPAVDEVARILAATGAPQILALRPLSPPKLVKGMFADLAKLVHPDKVRLEDKKSATEAFVKLKAARDAMLADFERMFGSWPL
jgi:hypothetical protein